LVCRVNLTVSNDGNQTEETIGQGFREFKKGDHILRLCNIGHY
jgi:hypothetical protein